MNIFETKVSKRDSLKALLGLAAVGSVGSLAACASGTGDVEVKTILSDVLFVEKGLSYFTGNATVAALLPANVLTVFDTAEADINTVLTSLSNAGDVVSVSTAQGYITLINKDVTTAIDAVIALQASGVSMPSKVTTVLEAVKALLPVLESAVSLAVSAFSASPNAVSPNQARAILANC